MSEKIIINNDEEMEELLESLEKFVKEANYFVERLSELVAEIDVALANRDGYVEDTVDKINDVITLLGWENKIHEKRDIDTITEKMSELHIKTLPYILEKEKEYKRKIQSLNMTIESLHRVMRQM